MPRGIFARLPRRSAPVMLALFCLAALCLPFLTANTEVRVLVSALAFFAAAANLVSCRRARRKTPPAPAQGTERRAAIMFVDIREFTLLTSRLEPESVFPVLNRLFEEIVPIVTAYDGVIDKYTGDGLMAVFGGEGELKNPALSAIRAALKIQEACAWLNCTSAYRKAAGVIEPIEMEVGIGIAKGKVLTGDLGTARHRDHTVVGRTVNLAARLCDLAGRGEVRCCNFAFLDIRDYARFHHGSEVKIKGIEFAIQTYRVEGLDLPAKLAAADRAVSAHGTRVRLAPLSALVTQNSE